MYTISDSANKEINKAKTAIYEALDTLSNTPEYNDKKSIFHASTVKQVNTLITIMSLLNDM